MGIVLSIVLLVSTLIIGCTTVSKPEVAKTEAPAPAPEKKELNSLERVKANGKIVAGFDDNYPPMGFRNGKGEIEGFDIDMAKEISKRIGIEIEWQPVVWETVVPSLLSKKFDVIISGMNITDKRLEVINFAGPYGKAGQALIVKVDNTTVNSMKDLTADKIGTQSGSTGFEYAKANGFDETKLKLYKEFPLAFNDLAVGRIDAIIIDAFAVNEFLQKRPGEFKQVGEVMGDEQIGIGIRKEDKELMEELNKAIEGMKKDGTLKTISMKWLGVDITEVQ